MKIHSLYMIFNTGNITFTHWKNKLLKAGYVENSSPTELIKRIEALAPIHLPSHQAVCKWFETRRQMIFSFNKPLKDEHCNQPQLLMPFEITEPSLLENINAIPFQASKCHLMVPNGQMNLVTNLDWDITKPNEEYQHRSEPVTSTEYRIKGSYDNVQIYQVVLDQNPGKVEAYLDRLKNLGIAN